MSVISVTNEVKNLKKVLLHRPGKELLNLTPNTLEELLFDDIPFLKMAQKEHDNFAQILRDNGVEVVYLEDLMAQSIKDNKELRDKFIRQIIQEGGVITKRYQKIVYDYLDSIKDDKELVLKTMEGINLNELDIGEKVSLVDMMAQDGQMILAPMPNLYFTRDPFASIGNGISLNKMYSITRSRETIFADYIFKYHKDFKDNVDLLYDRQNPFNIEGGDILNLSENVLAIGISQRTSPDAIDLIAKNIFYHHNTSIDTILAFDIPRTRAFMHLDTVFTQVDYDKFTVHPMILNGLRVFEIKKGTHDEELKIKEISDKLENILSKYLKIDKVDLILCSGGDVIASQREQWNDGSNTLCIKPGTIVVYDRNEVTNELMVKKGLTVLEMSSS
ncbi:MAG: arginine deiminase, partial [Peptostreptococcaceae bacterium]|nr:arginine deiminase [Peptostreptococcaceae bacterium]